ncbi:MAG TPA: CDP-alcohol phosphatidyltransferase family protein [Spirochaetota bacterium]|nr:CDP-alcohol phosphatidyltransferase family protein [Spirochaetota bacterium]
MMNKVKYLVPNFFTGLSFAMGLCAIIIMVHGIINPSYSSFFITAHRSLIIIAGWLLVWCVLFDKLDGFAAKALNASSEFGAQFDSMADLVSFGIAPSMLVFSFIYSTQGTWYSSNKALVIGSVLFFSLCAAIRLARFNAIDVEELAVWFRGLPSTIAGALIICSVLIYAKYDLITQYPAAAYFLPGLLVFSGILMVSTLYLSKLVPRKSKAINVFQIINIAGAFICGFATLFPEYLMGMIVLYLSVGFIYGFMKRNLITADARSAKQPG